MPAGLPNLSAGAAAIPMPAVPSVPLSDADIIAASILVERVKQSMSLFCFSRSGNLSTGNMADY